MVSLRPARPYEEREIQVGEERMEGGGKVSVSIWGCFFPTGMHKVMLSERIQIVSVVREVFRSKGFLFWVFCFGVVGSRILITYLAFFFTLCF